MNLYQYTLRSTIKSEPRITQTRMYIPLFEFKQACNYEYLIAVEKEKDKKADKDKIKFLQEHLSKIVGERQRHEYFSDNCVYMRFLNCFVSSPEGWHLLKKM